MSVDSLTIGTWYLIRGSGLVLLVCFTLSIVLGVVATARSATPALETIRQTPRFFTQDLHRNISVLSVLLMAVHATTAVLDSYVKINWWQALAPSPGPFKPLAVSLGALALDIFVLVTLTSLIRARLNPRGWRVVHIFVYAAWASSVVHMMLIGTDWKNPLGRILLWACVAVVAVALIARLRTLVHARHQRAATPSPDLTLSQVARFDATARQAVVRQSARSTPGGSNR